MKRLFLAALLPLFPAACTTGGGITDSLPNDPVLRQVAERYIAEAERVRIEGLPDGLTLKSRNIRDGVIVDLYEYNLKGMSLKQLAHALDENRTKSYIATLRGAACANREARLLLDKKFRYNFMIAVAGARKTSISGKFLTKGYCIAGESPFYNKKAVDDRFKMARRWPNGDAVDIRLVEKLTGTLQLAAIKFEPPAKPSVRHSVTGMKADGLMLDITLTLPVEKKNIRLDADWGRVAKGHNLDTLCTSQTHLLSMLIGAVYRYDVEIKRDTGPIASTEYTVSYDDCLLYNRKPGTQGS
ncbi:MAG: hypothetical protein EP348_10300 [Alphaproteobacteria bacterium]|nr:MAG: hypothetical protein EP348_10300 [Alphaproteobacteria bacterium]